MAVKFNDDQIDELLDRTEKGEPLAKVCSDARMPKRRTVYEWIECDPEFAARFRAARARGVHALVDQCLEIADEPVVDAVKVADKRVRIDTRLRLAGKWLPKEYGERIDVNQNVEVTHRHDLSGYSADELDALESLIAKASHARGDQGGEGETIVGSVH